MTFLPKCGRFARLRSPGHWSIRPMTYNTSTTWWKCLYRCYFSDPWIPHVQSLSFHAYSLFSGLNNDKCASSESTWSGRTAIGRTDLRAKRPDTHLPHSLTTMSHNNYMITLSSKALRGYRYATLFAVFIKTLKRLFISTEKTWTSSGKSVNTT